MNDELTKQLQDKYPQILQDVGGDPAITCMAWGVAVGAGWYKLLDDCMAEIMAMNPPSEFKAAQIKGKFGGLRFYADGGTAEIYTVINKAEKNSFDICEVCGGRGTVRKMYCNLCAECRVVK